MNRGENARTFTDQRTTLDPFGFRRRRTREVVVGNVGVGGTNPIRVQSMTTTDTLDTEATVAQTLRLVASGCEIVRITAPTVEDARNLGRIRDALRGLGCVVPLVADIHFNPAAALEAAKHVEKVRINPGNFADSKRFAVREYSDAEYDAELGRISQRFGPLVEVCKANGVAMRIGTNHGSLSDRIMNRFGDTPMGMVESALEFAGICRSHQYDEIIFSMKSSNPKIMVQAYRLLATRLDDLGWDYPFHLGVTEAGNGQDGRIKSAIGIGALLDDGIGDTIRVSLTEDPEAEVPVAFALARRFHTRPPIDSSMLVVDGRDPAQYSRHRTRAVAIGDMVIGGASVPGAIIDLADDPLEAWTSSQSLLRRGTDPDLPSEVGGSGMGPGESRVTAIAHADPAVAPRADAIALHVSSEAGIACLRALRDATGPSNGSDGTWVALIAGVGRDVEVSEVAQHVDALVVDVADPIQSDRWHQLAGTRRPVFLEVECDSIGAVPQALGALRRAVEEAERFGVRDLCFSVRSQDEGALVRVGRAIRGAYPDGAPPIWIRHLSAEDPEGVMLGASIAIGTNLCDGIGDAVSIGGAEVLGDGARTRLAYDVLQGASARISKTEYVACPSCGRTLFDLQETTTRIQARTSHLKGVKLAIMGCIVNGPGEMADADFGYVGGAPGKVNLYVGRECVEKGVLQSEADDRLIELIKRHGRWIDDPKLASASSNRSSR